MSKSQEKDPNNTERKPPTRQAIPPGWVLAIFLVAITSVLLIQMQGERRDEITQTHFSRQVEQERVDQPVEIVGKTRIRGYFLKDDKGRYPYKEKQRDDSGELNVPKVGGEPEQQRRGFYVTLSGSDQDVDHFTNLLRENGNQHSKRRRARWRPDSDDADLRRLTYLADRLLFPDAPSNARSDYGWRLPFRLQQEPREGIRRGSRANYLFRRCRIGER